MSVLRTLVFVLASHARTWGRLLVLLPLYLGALLLLTLCGSPWAFTLHAITMLGLLLSRLRVGQSIAVL